MTQNTTDNEPSEAISEVARCAQAVLTALNVGDIQSGSPLHLKLREVMIAYRERAARAPAAAPQPPMCAVHAALDGEDKLVLEAGNGCIACSLHERTALLNLLGPFAADDASQDSLTVLRNLIVSRAPLAAVGGDVTDALKLISTMLHEQLHDERQPVSACLKFPCDKVNAILAAAASSAPAEPPPNDHDSCSHWREGDSDNCVLCGDDLGPTTEADVEPEGEQENDKFHCENCERDFLESPHATDDGCWLCNPCWKGLQ